MHTHNSSKFRFHYDAHFDGDIICINKETEQETVIPAEDILDLVATCYVAPRKIAKLEQADAQEILLGAT